MIYPPLNELMKKTGSRYSLVIATAKRAREITAGSQPLAMGDTDKPVSIAINEIFQNRIKIVEKKKSAEKQEINIEKNDDNKSGDDVIGL